MSRAQSPVGEREYRPAGLGFDADLVFLRRFAGPLVLLGRAMLAYIFIVEGYGKIAGYAGVAAYMRDHGVSSALLPLVILTELGGGLLVLAGLKTRWAAIALFGFCLLTALFFHLRRGSDGRVAEERRHGRGIPRPGDIRARRLVDRRPARTRRLAGPWMPARRAQRRFRRRAGARRRARPVHGPRDCCADRFGRHFSDRLAGPHRRRAGERAQRRRQFRLARLHRARLAFAFWRLRPRNRRSRKVARRSRQAGVGDVQVGL